MSKKIFAIFFLVTSPLCYGYDFDKIAEQHIIPGYLELSTRTENLDHLVNSYCTSLDTHSLVELQKAHIDAFLAWQSVQHIRFGPIQYLSREHRYAFWPDKRGIVSKQLNKLLADPALLESEFDISQQSVALQGFTALERILFANNKLDNKHCSLMTAISKNLHTMSSNLIADWTGDDGPHIDFFIDPGPGNLIYGSTQELASELLKSLFTQLEFIVIQKLSLPLGSSIEKPRGKLAEAAKSKNTLASLKANLNACHQLYNYSFATELTDTSLHEKIESAFQQTQTSLDNIEIPLSEAVSDPEQRVLVTELRKDFTLIKQLISADLATSLDLTIGFNSLDGD